MRRRQGWILLYPERRGCRYLTYPCGGPRGRGGMRGGGRLMQGRKSRNPLYRERWGCRYLTYPYGGNRGWATLPFLPSLTSVPFFPFLISPPGGPRGRGGMVGGGRLGRGRLGRSLPYRHRRGCRNLTYPCGDTRGWGGMSGG